MIGALEGVLQEKTPTRVLINVSGVSYEVSIPLSTFYELPEENATVLLRIHTHLREDALQLFGFRSSEERTLFEELIRVSGIGPKLAMVILSGLSADALQVAIRSDDTKALQAIPGVGKKTAQRLVLDLRDRLDRLFETPIPPRAEALPSESHLSDSGEQARSALENLGYGDKLAARAVELAQNELGEEASVEILLRQVLRSLAK